MGTSEIESAAAARYLRAFDFQPESAAKARTLRQLAFGRASDGKPRPFFVAAEALLRMPELDLAADHNSREAIDELLRRGQGTAQFARLVQRYGLSSHYPSLVEVAARNRDNPVGIASALTLLEAGAQDTIREFVVSQPELAAAAVEAVGNTRSSESVPLLARMLLDQSLAPPVRDRAVRSLAGTSQGAEALVNLARDGQFPAELAEIAGAAITRSMNVRLREQAAELFPVPPLRDSEPLPQMTDLLVLVGDPDNGASVFESATCSDCHIIDGAGTDFGPELSKIGDKLPKAGIYEAVLDPSASVSPTYDLVHLSLARQDEVSGFVVSETEQTVTLRMEGGIVADFAQEEILERRTSTVSAMPDDLQEQMSVDDLVDLVEFLSQLR